MAKAWQDFGKKLDDEARDALLAGGFDYDSYSSDDERIRAALDMLYHLPLWKKARYDDLKRMRNKYAYDEKGVDPFAISNVASIIGSWKDKVDADGKSKLTQGDQFFNQYWKADKNQREYWKDAIEGKLGKGAWEQVKQRMNSRLKDEAVAKMDKDRRDIVEGNAEGQGITDWLASAVGGVLMPRTKEKALEGKNVEDKDIALDLVESAAMALPFAPAKLAGKAITAAAIPFASELLDAIAYKTENPNDIAERADFNPVDVGVGTAVNLVAPEAMKRATKRVISRLGGGSRQGASKEVLDVVNDLKKQGKFDATKTNYWMDEADDIRLAEAKKLEDEALTPHKMNQGYKTTDEEVLKAFESVIDSHEGLESAKKKGNEKLVGVNRRQLYENLGDDDVLKDIYNRAKERAKKSGDIRSEMIGSISEYNELANDAAKKIAEDAGELTLEQRAKLVKADELYGLYNSGKGYTPAEELAGRLEDNIDNLISIRNSGANAMDLMALKHPKASRMLSTLGNAGSTFAANKAGNQGNVEKAVSPIEGFLGKPGMLSKPLRKLQTEQREQARTAQAQAVLNVLADNAETDEDRKWLKALAQNPGLARGEGAEALDSGFRKWMLVKGSDILRGTDLYRPTFDVR